jgi:hypothetical protein
MPLSTTGLIAVIVPHQALLSLSICCTHAPSSTLSSAVSPLRRRSTVQLNLAFWDIPNPSEMVWEQLEEEPRSAALELLARLIAEAAQNGLDVEGNDDD